MGPLRGNAAAWIAVCLVAGLSGCGERDAEFRLGERAEEAGTMDLDVSSPLPVMLDSVTSAVSVEKLPRTGAVGFLLRQREEKENPGALDPNEFYRYLAGYTRASLPDLFHWKFLYVGHTVIGGITSARILDFDTGEALSVRTGDTLWDIPVETVVSGFVRMKSPEEIVLSRLDSQVLRNSLYHRCEYLGLRTRGGKEEGTHVGRFALARLVRAHVIAGTDASATRYIVGETRIDREELAAIQNWVESPNLDEGAIPAMLPVSSAGQRNYYYDAWNQSVGIKQWCREVAETGAAVRLEYAELSSGDSLGPCRIVSLSESTAEVELAGATATLTAGPKPLPALATCDFPLLVLPSDPVTDRQGFPAFLKKRIIQDTLTRNTIVYDPSNGTIDNSGIVRTGP